MTNSMRNQKVELIHQGKIQAKLADSSQFPKISAKGLSTRSCPIELPLNILCKVTTNQREDY